MTMHIGHVALQVPDLDLACAHVARALGLRERSRSTTEALFTANTKHHELQLVAGDRAGLDHVGLEVADEAALEVLVARALQAGAQPLPGGDIAGLRASARFTGPGGITYEAYCGMERDALAFDAHLRPGVRKLGHLTFMSSEPEAILAFWLDGLGMRVSDAFQGLTWTRCDADHHGLAVGPGPEGTVLHHHAWEVQDVAALAQHCDDIARRDVQLIWGPVRHGPGFNIATYLPDTGGGLIEVYTDMLRIQDEDHYTPIDWSTEPRSLNLWGPAPGEDLLQAGLPVIDARRERRDVGA